MGIPGVDLLVRFPQPADLLRSYLSELNPAVAAVEGQIGALIKQREVLYKTRDEVRAALDAIAPADADGGDAA